MTDDTIDIAPVDDELAFRAMAQSVRNAIAKYDPNLDFMVALHDDERLRLLSRIDDSGSVKRNRQEIINLLRLTVEHLDAVNNEPIDMSDQN